MAFTWEGNSKESLLQKLKELDELTCIDSIIRPKQKLKIQATAYGCGMLNWKIEPDNREFKTEKLASGSRFDQFCQAISELEKSIDMDVLDLKVLAHCDTEENRTYDGQYTSKWFCIDPLCPYTLDEKTGQPVFAFEEIFCSEAEYQMLMETKMAFKAGGIYYAFSKESMNSIGRMLDARAALKRIEDHMLGGALVLADALAERDSLKCICRRTPGNIRYIVNLIGDRYYYIPQKDFFQEIFHAASFFGMYEIKKWKVTESKTCIDLVLCGSTDYQTGFLVTASDYGGVPMSVSAYGRFSNGATIILHEEKMGHNKIDAAAGVERMFAPMQKAFQTFADFYSEMDDYIYYDAELYCKELKKIKKLIGSGRYKNAELPKSGMYHGITLAMKLSDKLYADIRDADILQGMIWELLHKVHENVKTTVKDEEETMELSL